jgi:hypothetical protein
MRWLAPLLGALGLLGLILWLGGSPAPEQGRAVTTTSLDAPVTTSITVPTPVPTPAPVTTSTTVAAEPVRSPEEARGFLERHGIDPDQVAREIAEQLQRRSQPPP